jgi:putative ABC transport system permease protein
LEQTPAVYIPMNQAPFADPVMTLVIRTRGDARSLAADVRRAVWSVDKDQPVVRIAQMRELLDASASERRFALVLFELFAIAALILASAGIYGVLAGSVAERTREIGVRSALGATRSSIALMIAGEGMRVTGLGVVIGLAGAVAATRLLASMLFGVSALDAVTYLSVVGLLAAVSLIACSIPALRAASVEPARTLRTD